MVNSVSVENPDWWQLPQPTAEELRLSGGLLVEDWPHARQVERLSTQLFHATRPLHELDDQALRLLERAAFPMKSLPNSVVVLASAFPHFPPYYASPTPSTIVTTGVSYNLRPCQS